MWWMVSDYTTKNLKPVENFISSFYTRIFLTNGAARNWLREGLSLKFVFKTQKTNNFFILSDLMKVDD